MAVLMLVEHCSVRYQGRAAREADDATFVVLVKENGVVTLQSLAGGTHPEFWNSEGSVRVERDGTRVRLVSGSFTGETLECVGECRFEQVVTAPGPVASRVHHAEPRPRLPGTRPARPLTPQEDAVLTRMKRWRTQEARARVVSPFVVATDACLRAIILARPTTLDELRLVPGMGEARVARYGGALLAFVVDLEPEDAT